MDHQTWREWLDLDVDGALGDEERRRLAGHLAGCGECVAERRRLEALAARLAAGKIALRPDFKASVMAALPPAPWESRSRRAWRLPAVLLAGLAVAAALLAGVAAADPAPLSGPLSALSALGEVFAAAIAAGTGMASASWRGVGSAVGEWLAASRLNQVAALLLLVGLNLLAFRLIRRRRRPAAAPVDRRAS